MANLRMAEDFVGAVTVGERGQVVIPAEARERLGISAGDKLLVFAHPAGLGVAFVSLAKVLAAKEELTRVLEELDQPGSLPSEALARDHKE